MIGGSRVAARGKSLERRRADASQPFEDPDDDELVEGFLRNQPSYGLLVFMRDFGDLGSPLRAGERHVAR